MLWRREKKRGTGGLRRREIEYLARKKGGATQRNGRNIWLLNSGERVAESVERSEGEGEEGKETNSNF